MTDTSIFTRILNGEIPAEIIGETDRLFALRDIAPQGQVHLIVVPKSAEYRDVKELAAGDPALLVEKIAFAGPLAKEHPGDGDFRLVCNTGANAGQTVFHVHAHVLAGGLTEKSVGA